MEIKNSLGIMRKMLRKRMFKNMKNSRLKKNRVKVLMKMLISSDILKNKTISSPFQL